MKSLWWILLSVVAGSVTGYGLTWAEFRPTSQDMEWVNLQPDAAKTPSGGAVEPASGPQAYVYGDGVHLFGLMETNTESSHEFLIANHGQAPLTLTLATTSCRCTVSKLADNKGTIELAPGEETPVTLEWNTKGKVGPFAQSAEIRTNDYNKLLIKLHIEGDVLQTAIVEPPELVLSSLTTTTQSQADIRVYSVREDAFELSNVEFTDATTAGFFDVELSPIPQDELKIDNTKCGWLVHVTIKPGLPLGPLAQRLRLKSTLHSLPEITIPILGIVGGDIRVVGGGWNAKLGALLVGVIKSDDGASKPLQLHIRGQERQNIKIEVEKATPDFLKVEFGEQHELVQGAIVVVPLTLSIPAGCQPCNHLGTDASPSGEVILTTNHPDAKQVRIKVNFAVAR